MTDMIVRWDEVRDGDMVLCNGALEAAVLLPHGNAWQPEGCVSIMVGGSWRTPRRAALTAVRRSTPDGSGTCDG